jgi:molybdopterin-guanine dinucleotide biosynthesis protein B
VEGFKREQHPKLEVFRAAVGKPALHPQDPRIVAVASDSPLPGCPVPVVDLGDIPAIADIVQARAVALAAALKC